MSKKRTGVLRMEVNMRLCRHCVALTSKLNKMRFLMKPKMMVAPVKPVKTDEKTLNDKTAKSMQSRGGELVHVNDSK